MSPGPGFLVASLADAVGPSGAVHGLDQSEPMNTVARDLTSQPILGQYRRG